MGIRRPLPSFSRIANSIAVSINKIIIDPVFITIYKHKLIPMSNQSVSQIVYSIAVSISKIIIDPIPIFILPSVSMGII